MNPRLFKEGRKGNSEGKETNSTWKGAVTFQKNGIDHFSHFNVWVLLKHRLYSEALGEAWDSAFLTEARCHCCCLQGTWSQAGRPNQHLKLVTIVLAPSMYDSAINTTKCNDRARYFPINAIKYSQILRQLCILSDGDNLIRQEKWCWSYSSCE